MGTYYNNIQNFDDVIFRECIIGLIKSLNHKITWNNTINNINKKIDVPFYFTVAGSERFLQNLFLNDDKLIEEEKATGKYDKIPRGHVNLVDIGLQEDLLTNKYKRANYVEQDNGQLTQYNAEFMDMPFLMNFELTIFVDSIIDVFKCTQATYQELYKNVYFYVDYKGTRISCYYAIPPNIQNSKPMEFNSSDKKEIKLNFNIELAIVYPLFKDSTKLTSANRMDTITANIHEIIPRTENWDNGRPTDIPTQVFPNGNNNNPLPN